MSDGGGGGGGDCRDGYYTLEERRANIIIMYWYFLNISILCMRDEFKYTKRILVLYNNIRLIDVLMIRKGPHICIITYMNTYIHVEVHT